MLTAVLVLKRGVDLDLDDDTAAPDFGGRNAKADSSRKSVATAAIENFMVCL